MNTPKIGDTLKVGDRLTVHVDRLAIGGRGVARHDGLVLFIADTAPDEDVEVEITFLKKNFAEARLVRVVQPSPHRREPECPVAGRCGGCSWQHVSYSEQLKQKRGLVQEAIRRFSGFELEVAEVTPSPNEYRYRNRIQLHHADGNVGFFQRGSRTIVDINDCFIAEDSIGQRIANLKAALKKARPGRTEMFVDRSGKAHSRLLAAATKRTSDDAQMSEAVGPAFSQVNSAQNRIFVEAVVSFMSERYTVLQGTRGAASPAIFDLYAGSGNFTFPIGKALPHAHITAVELSAESVRDADDRLKREAKYKNITFMHGDVARFLANVDMKPRSLVLLDPPRAGCEEQVMRELARQRPAVILYVSCHPVTLARDLRFLHDADYKLEQIRPFDMFPQTDHVESLAILSTQR